MHKSIILAPFAAAILMGASAPSGGGYASTGTPVSGGSGGSVQPDYGPGPGFTLKGRWSPEEVKIGYAQSIKALRKDVNAQKIKDGGELTADHDAMFQRRLHRIKDFHRRQLNNAS